MKITKSQLKQIIKEELEGVVQEDEQEYAKEEMYAKLPDDVKRELFALYKAADGLYEQWRPLMQKFSKLGLWPGPNNAIFELSKSVSAPVNHLKSFLMMNK